MKPLYDLAINGYSAALRIASIFNDKAAEWYRGRKDQDIETAAEQIDRKKTIIWFHVASLGEFEQARPVLEALKQKEWHILVSHFSPSALRVKDHPAVDTALYLPSDTRKNAQHFISTIRPDIAVFVKYEIWINYISVLHAKSIPAILLGARFYKNHWLFTFPGKYFSEILKNFEKIFTADIDSYKILKDKGYSNIEQSNDTRIDRALKTKNSPSPFWLKELMADVDKIFVFGSTWPEDEKIIEESIHYLVRRNFRCIIAPHNISESQLSRLKKRWPGGIKKTEWESGEKSSKIIFLDTMGELKEVYRIAHVAYIGGGFGKGIHSIIEPAVFGIPIIFGPQFKKFPEAKELIARGGAISINNSNQLLHSIKKVLKPDVYSEMCEAVIGYVDANKGATEKIVTYLTELDE